jgi:hypothetical protein
MENKDIPISTVEISDNNIIITYENSNIETLPINMETYKKMYEEWLKPLPPFISDKYKTIMRALILVSTTNNTSELSKLSNFFTSANIENVKLFLTYMKGRVVLIPIDKQKWHS